MKNRVPRKNKFRSRSYKFIFDNIWNGLLAYYTYYFISLLGRTKLESLLKIIKKEANLTYRTSKLLEYKFKYLYKSLLFKDAYACQFERAVFIEKESPRERSNTFNYLDVVWDNEYEDFFDLEEETLSYLKDRKGNKDIFNWENNKKKRSKIGRVLFFGPSAEIKTIKNNSFEYICLTKPVDLTTLPVESDKVILVLNNMWSIHKKIEVKKWIDQNPRSIIFSPNKIQGNDYNAESFKVIPSFMLGSLMGIQRAITIVLSKFDPAEIKIIGFDFYLSDYPIKPWYPSLYKDEGFRSEQQGILFATLNHDFLLNFNYMKRIKEFSGIKMSGDMNKYLNKDIDEVFKKFKQNLV